VLFVADPLFLHLSPVWRAACFSGAGGVVVSFATVYVIGLASVLLISGTALIVDGIRRYVNAGFQEWKATRPLAVRGTALRNCVTE